MQAESAGRAAEETASLRCQLEGALKEACAGAELARRVGLEKADLEERLAQLEAAGDGTMSAAQDRVEALEGERRELLERLSDSELAKELAEAGQRDAAAAAAATAERAEEAGAECERLAGRVKELEEEVGRSLCELEGGRLHERRSRFLERIDCSFFAIAYTL